MKVTRTTRRAWTADDDAQLRSRYPHELARVIAADLQRTERSIYERAKQLGVTKSEAFRASLTSGRVHRFSTIGVATRFQKGHVPLNKGLRRPGWAPGRMKDTQFRVGERRGRAAQIWCPVGTIRPDTEGYLRIKVREARAGEAYGLGNVQVWPLLQRHLWEQAHGPIPPGYAVRFKDGNRQHCVLDNLELVSRADLLRRNSVHTLPKPLAETIQLLGALTRQINRRSRDAQEPHR